VAQAAAAVPGPAAAVRPAPALGTPPGTVSPAIAVPVPAGQPRPGAEPAATVESFEEETHSCQASDTFRSISEHYYNSAKYERALLLFNRNHPRASDAVRHDPPVLSAGQLVFIPPLRILESRYASVIPELTPLPPAPAGAPVGLEAPRPLARPGLVTAGASGTPSTSWSMPASGPSYRVRKSGEKFLDMARHTLGNADRWWDIYLLNKGYNPTETVPGGTVLRLPADAHVEPEDAP
jgi:nucleoid-associated protein YgaU